MKTVSKLYDGLLEKLFFGACGVLFLMMLMICADVFLRNVPVVLSLHGLSWADEISEYMLYLITMLAAPWLLRQGRHIRIDILLRALPAKAGWYCEWLADGVAFACCVIMVIYGAEATYTSYSSGMLTIQTLVTPEWWSLAPLPLAFLLLAIEVLFRMQRLGEGPQAPRDDAMSTP
ncbi:MAG TPA: TRAP transporter small permease [Xanthobacteraceae bacterium]|jgi:TRAP-type C4-dicarboxylate transport system permease small subunit|nr:TRAP transporter small permease [Xanthobacteraceae bacterium]